MTDILEFLYQGMVLIFSNKKIMYTKFDEDGSVYRSKSCILDKITNRGKGKLKTKNGPKMANTFKTGVRPTTNYFVIFNRGPANY